MISQDGSPVGLRDLAARLAVAVLPLVAIISQAGVLPAIPLLALVVALIFGRFPGERMIERLASRPTVSPRAWAPPTAPLPVPTRTLLRSRLLIAASFAGRPPPASLQPAR